MSRSLAARSVCLVMIVALIAGINMAMLSFMLQSRNFVAEFLDGGWILALIFVAFHAVVIAACREIVRDLIAWFRAQTRKSLIQTGLRFARLAFLLAASGLCASMLFEAGIENWFVPPSIAGLIIAWMQFARSARPGCV